MTYRNIRNGEYAEQAVIASYMASNLENLALERITATQAAKIISTEDIEVKSKDLIKFLKEKGYGGWRDYSVNIRTEHHCKNNPCKMRPKPKPRIRREIGACYDRMQYYHPCRPRAANSL